MLVNAIILHKEFLELLQYCSLQQFELNPQLLYQDMNYIYSSDQQTGQFRNRFSLH